MTNQEEKANTKDDTVYYNNMLTATRFVVEATANEVQMLWERFAYDALPKTELNSLHWKQVNPGYVIQRRISMIH